MVEQMSAIPQLLTESLFLVTGGGQGNGRAIATGVAATADADRGTGRPHDRIVTRALASALRPKLRPRDVDIRSLARTFDELGGLRLGVWRRRYRLRLRLRFVGIALEQCPHSCPLRPAIRDRHPHGPTRPGRSHDGSVIAGQLCGAVRGLMVPRAS